MDAGIRPRIRTRTCAPNTVPCPDGGTRGRRQDTHTRRVRDLAYRPVLFLDVTAGEYRAACPCRKTFRSRVHGLEPRAGYTNRVRDAVRDRLLDDGTSLNRVREAMRRDFPLELSDGFLSDCLDWKVRQLDCPADRRWTLAHFSGTLCVDEVHLGHRTLLVATDPLGDFPVVSANDRTHLGRFPRNFRGKGFSPRVVVTGGSNLYPAVLAEIWPAARHQLCVFHVLKDLNACVFDALRRMRRRHAATGGRKRKRGRPKNRRGKHGPTQKDQAHFVWRNRYRITTRPENRGEPGRRRLRRLFEYLPGLRMLRSFVLRVYALFDPDQSVHQAKCRRAALTSDAALSADPDLARALSMLGAVKFDQMIAYLRRPVRERVRTNNPVERANRRRRYFEKVRYKWRRRRTIVRFVLLAVDRWWQRRMASEPPMIAPRRENPEPDAKSVG